MTDQTTPTGATPDLVALHRRALDGFGRRVHAVVEDGWHQPTPCPDWDVAELVNHVVGENRWAPSLLGGGTIADVGDSFDGDLLAGAPHDAWDRSAAEVADAAAATSLDVTVHLSFGDVPAEEYLWQLTADLLVHGWDLARATGQDESLDADVVDAVADWFTQREDLYRGAGVIGPAMPAVDQGAGNRLLATFGRDASPDTPLAVIGRFNAAFNGHDVDTLRPLITDDCVFVDTTPPRGGTHRGADAVLSAFAALFRDSPSAYFETLGGSVAENGAAYRWLYRWGEGDSDCVEGVDVFRCRDGKVAAKLAYVKG
jgi:uncharacterized protein (TIGR03086 family)